MGPIFRTKDAEQSQAENNAISEADYILMHPPGRCTGAEIAALQRAKLACLDATGTKAREAALASLKLHLANYEDVA